MTIQQGLIETVQSVEQIITDTHAVLSDQRQRLAQVDQTFANLRDLRMVEGDPTRPGCVRRAILQGIVYATGGSPGLSSGGDMPRIDLGSTNNVYMHIKLPLKLNVNNRMFHLRFKGYNYGSAKPVNETVVGYCKASTQRLEGVHTKGNFVPTVYVDANQNIVVRFFFENIYYTTMVIDSMMVT